jgi:hypothetical protein
MKKVVNFLNFIIILLLINKNISKEINIGNNGEDKEGCGSKENPCQTISYALQISNKKDDKIIMLEGIYKGDFNRGFKIHNEGFHLQSINNDPTKTIIDCEKSRIGLFRFENSTVFFSGITLKNCECVSNQHQTCIGESPIISIDSQITFQNMIMMEHKYKISFTEGAVRLVGNIKKNKKRIKRKVF